MIPILYAPTEVYFTSNGIGRLSDCISCEVTEERNGIYEAVFVYPITGIHYHDIGLGNIIYVTHDATRTPQPFVIYKRSATINGVVTFNAHHISYRLNNIICVPSSSTLPVTIAGTAQEVLDTLDGLHVNPSAFDLFADPFDSNTITMTKPESLKRLIAGEQGSVLSVFGGELEYNGFTVYLHQHRGEERGVTIRYGKDMIGLTAEFNEESTYTGIVPYWKNDVAMVTLSAYFILADGAPANELVLNAVDLTSQFSEMPTENALEEAAQAYLAKTPYPWLGVSNVKVDFVLLSQSPEYSGATALNDILLCDIVKVYFRDLGVDVNEKVIKTVYNTLTDTYISVELGVPQQTLTDVVAKRVENDLKE